MGKVRRYFWSDWPMVSQQRFFKVVLVGALLATFSVSVGLKLFAGSLSERINDSKEMYARVVPIVEDVKSLRAQQGNLAHLPIEEATWSIIDDLLMEGVLTSIRKTTVNGGTEAVQVTFTGLSLTKLTDFMVALRDRASLQTPNCSLSRNPDDPRLADAHFVLAR